MYIQYQAPFVVSRLRGSPEIAHIARMTELGTNSPAVPTRDRRTGIIALLCALGPAGILGCAAIPGQQEDSSMALLASKVQTLEYQLLATQVAISELTGKQVTTQQTLGQQITSLNDKVEHIPEALTAICELPTTSAESGERGGSVQTVVMSGGKMVVGEMERVWIDPPGASLIARIDTGAQSSSLHAENMVEFERDGDDWVRFDLRLNEELTTLERAVARYVRVYQQADPEGTLRPVVSIRLRLGDVKDSFEFTLADRTHLDSQMLLGRNFLSDMALVDVGKQFVQPLFKPKRR
jgi:hypothetical protein